MDPPAAELDRRLPAGFAAGLPPAGSPPAAPAAARDAATVVLLRDAPGGLEAYLLRRTASMAFAAGMHVFPGGAVDPRDEGLPASSWVGPSPQAWSGILTASPARARALACAAVRETFEETGVLLAGSTGGDVLADVSAADWEAERRGLLDRSSSLAEMLVRRRLVLRADLLRPWAHWITPESEPRRYDTRFFVAAMPAGQRTRHVGGEADEVIWLRPRDALAAAERGAVGMLPPTAFTLTELAGYPDVPAVLAAADGRDVRPVLPRIVVSGPDAVVLLPGEPGYEE